MQHLWMLTNSTLPLRSSVGHSGLPQESIAMLGEVMQWCSRQHVIQKGFWSAIDAANCDNAVASASSSSHDTAADLDAPGRQLRIHYIRRDGENGVQPHDHAARTYIACHELCAQWCPCHTPIYQKCLSSVQNWGLHVWGDAKRSTDWESPLMPRMQDDAS